MCQHDAVGNMLSITCNTGGVEAPSITAFTPSTGNAGMSINVSISSVVDVISFASGIQNLAGVYRLCFSFFHS